MAYKLKSPKLKEKKSNIIYQVDIIDKETGDNLDSELFDTEKEAKIYAEKSKKELKEEGDNVYAEINKSDRETGSFDI